jgi:hypothetical protein
MAMLVLQQIISLFIVIMVGYWFAAKKLFTEGFAKGLGAYITKAGFPVALIFNMQQPFSYERLEQLGIIVVAMAVFTVGGILLCAPLCLLRRTPRREAAVWVTTASSGNAVFMGAPIYHAMYGDEAGFPLSAIIFAFTLLTYTIAFPLINAKEQGSVSAADVCKMLIRNPGIIAAFVGFGLFWFSISLPVPVMGGLRLMNNTLTPCAMLVIGYFMAQIPFKELFSDVRVYLVSAVKLLLVPLFTFYLMREFIQSPVLLGIICVSAAMPTAAVVSSFCEQSDNNPVLCSKITFATTLLSVVTVPLCILMMQGYI